jgi:hypothetical protein
MEDYQGWGKHEITELFVIPKDYGLLGAGQSLCWSAYIPQQSNKQIALLSCIQSSPCRMVLCVSSRDGAVQAKAVYLWSRVRPLALFIVIINCSLSSYSSNHISTIIYEFALPAPHSVQGNCHSRSRAASTSTIQRCGIHGRAVQIQQSSHITDWQQ